MGWLKSNKIKVLIGLFLLMVALDVGSTHLALSMGGTELNPIVGLILQDSLGLNLLIKLTIASLAILVVMKLVPEVRQYTIILVLVIGMECVVAWNCGMIASVVL